MSKKDFGYDFLNSDDSGFIRNDDGDSYRYTDGSGYYHGSDGSEGYIYSDGSGYFHGADGSDGYIYSDGSAYYHGADGSDGYKYSDGSGYYHGADGSDGYRYSDGSGYFNDANGDLSSFDYYEDDDDSEISAGAAIVGGLIGVGLAAYAANKQKRDEERREEERRIAEQERIRQEKADRRRKKRISFYKRHWKGIFVFFLILGLSGFAGYKYWDYQKQIAIGSSTEELLGENYENVIEKLKDAGFTNVDSNPMYDLFLDEIEQEFLVTEVRIRGSSKFSATDKYAYDARIEVTYHVVENIYTPLSSKEAKKQLYEDVVTSFKNAGFANITTVADPDLITGWITKDGSVEEIAVNGDTSFDENDRYRPDCEVVITYHTFK